MSYIPSNSGFNAYLSTLQNATTASYDLEFDTFTNIVNNSSTQLVLPARSLAFSDCRSTKDSGDADGRHAFTLVFSQGSLTARVRSHEASGGAGIWSNNQAPGIAYGLNDTSGDLSSRVQVTSLFNDPDQTANFNRIVGFKYQ
jgi:hypothetical protein